MTIQERLESICKLASAATPGPWREVGPLSIVTSQSHPLCEISDPYHRQCVHGTGQDGPFISQSRTLVPLLAEALAVAVESLEKVSDPRKRDHKEPDAYTELGCVMNIAESALSQIEKLLEER